MDVSGATVTERGKRDPLMSRSFRFVFLKRAGGTATHVVVVFLFSRHRVFDFRWGKKEVGEKAKTNRKRERESAEGQSSWLQFK